MAVPKKVDDERLGAAITPLVREHGLVLEDVTFRRVGEQVRINVTVDLPEDAVGGVDLDTVAEVSRAISALIDADDTLIGEGPSLLEVTTPGVFRPLTELRHVKRMRTRVLSVRVRDGRRFVGRLMDVSGSDLIFDVLAKPHERKKREGSAQGGAGRVPAGELILPWSEVEHAEVELEFR